MTVQFESDTDFVENIYESDSDEWSDDSTGNLPDLEAIAGDLEDIAMPMLLEVPVPMTNLPAFRVTPSMFRDAGEGAAHSSTLLGYVRQATRPPLWFSRHSHAATPFNAQYRRPVTHTHNEVDHMFGVNRAGSANRPIAPFPWLPLDNVAAEVKSLVRVKR
jgi:hypothetical protein